MALRASGRGPLVVGLVFETFDSYPRRDTDPPDFHVEYEPIGTVEVLEAAICELGHRPLRLGSPHSLLEAIGRSALPAIDVALNIAEGHGSRNREAWAPSLLEMAGVPCLGSDGLTLSLTLDKAWASRTVAADGLPVVPQCVMSSARQAAHGALPGPFPLFVKPRWEGSAKGIRASSRVENRSALEREVARVVRDYRQPALVEIFLAGAEYTVAVVGNDPPRPLPVLQRALESGTRIGLHALETASAATSPGVFEHCLPGELTASLESELQELACRIYQLFECRDFARVDFRLDPDGRPVFLEINPLPTFAADGSFAILAELEGRPLAGLLADVIDAGLKRLAPRLRSDAHESS